MKKIMSITATELKNNLGHYLKLAESQEILVTKNGKNIIRMSPVNQNRSKALESLKGSLKGADFTLEEAKDAYFKEKYDLHY